MKTNKIVFIIPAILAILLSVISTGFTEDKNEIRSVKASGSAAILKGDVEGAKKTAIQDAKRNAVDQVGSQVISQTVVENFDLVKDKIITKLDGYVHNYKIVEEKQVGESYSVKIEAEISKSELIDDATLIYHDMDKPRVMVIVAEASGKEIIPSSHTENIVSEFFIEKGFKLIDQATAKANIKADELRKIAEGDEKAAVKAGLRSGAEVVIVGTASLGEVESVKGILYASKATVSLRALRTDNASLYAVSSKSESAADGIADAAKRKAVEATGKSTAKDIFWKVVKKWNDEKNMGAEVELVITDVTFSKLKKITESLKSAEGVSDVIQRSFDDPTAVFNLTFKGDTNRLAEILNDTKFEAARFEVLSVSSGKINLRVK